MRILNTVYVTEHGARVGYRRGSVSVRLRSGHEQQRIPINAVDGIVLAARAQASAELLTECAQRGVRLAALTGNGRLRFTVGSPVNGNVHLRVAQHRLAATPTELTRFAKSFVAGKLQNCRRALLRWARDGDTNTAKAIHQYREAVEDRMVSLNGVEGGHHIRGIEGDGTRNYFRGMGLHLDQRSTGFSYVRRSRRPPRDPLNAALSYCYGLLLAEIVGALDSAGLDPQVGFLHGVRFGRPSLALDVLEEFRPSLADRFVIRSIMRRQLRTEHFTSGPGRTCYLSDNGRSQFLQLYETWKSEEVRHSLLGRWLPRVHLPQVQATLLARAVRGDIHSYPPFVVEV